MILRNSSGVRIVYAPAYPVRANLPISDRIFLVGIADDLELAPNKWVLQVVWTLSDDNDWLYWYGYYADTEIHVARGRLARTVDDGIGLLTGGEFYNFNVKRMLVAKFLA